MMSDYFASTRFRHLVDELVELASRRAQSEREIVRTYRADDLAADEAHRLALEQIESRHEHDARATDSTHRAALDRARDQFEATHSTTEAEYTKTHRRIRSVYSKGIRLAKQTYEQDSREITRQFESGKALAIKRYREIERQLGLRHRKLSQLQQEALTLLDEWRLAQLAEGINAGNTAVTEDLPPATALSRMNQALDVSQAQLRSLQLLTLPGLLRSGVHAWIFVGFWGLAIYPLALLLGWMYGAVAAGITALVSSMVLVRWLSRKARTTVRRLYEPVARARLAGQAVATAARQEAHAQRDAMLAELQQVYERETLAAQKRDRERQERLRHERDDRLLVATDDCTRTLAALKAVYDRRVSRELDVYPKQCAWLETRHRDELKEAHWSHQRRTAEITTSYQQSWSDLAIGWRQGLERIHGEIGRIATRMHQLCPPWPRIIGEDWTPPEQIPPALRFGQFEIDLTLVPDAVPRDQRLATDHPTNVALPMLLPVPDGCSLLLETGEDGRAQADQILQVVMLRYLTALPPGRVQLTIIDPLGLGKSYSGFMNLVDFNEQVINQRIWTEPQQIDQRLAEITEHMENVIQKYLRSRFETLDEFNAQAGVMAEPYRVVVVANFPTGFQETSARRLATILGSGARCGVYALISANPGQRMPADFEFGELRQCGTVLTWSDGRFTVNNHPLGRWPLRFDSLPSSETLLAIMAVAGRYAQASIRVEVPFESIVPAPQERWTHSARGEVRVPLGPAGAVEIQALHLGRGTAQHVLIAGKTGSGKSSLLHALITNVALHYGPDQVELYLIDFKKGVELKTYADRDLPHASVVAIESEREFGLSVMQRLDEELRVRGEKFRAVGAQDLSAYRDARPESIMPRILLIVDEFQEFFVEEDKIAQEAELLLDRLVRQGRAFGIHVILGSQTLGGAYSLARSTIGQMAVRIALQCSEADASLILSDDNTAAQYLTRPGKAIYNDAGGLVEGNRPFQVAWLGDRQRDKYLGEVAELARSSGFVRRAPLVVFEGNAPAELADNRLVDQLLVMDDWPANRQAARVWLGDAIAIKDPTSILFRAQSGNNLLIVGQNDTAARAIFASTLIALAAQHPVETTRRGTPAALFYLLDGSPPDTPNAGYLASVAEVLPHDIQLVGWRDLAATLTKLSTEVDRRLHTNDPDAPTLYLLIHDLQRFRALRRQEDDFSFSRSGEDEAPSTDRMFADILREGPAVGVHTIMWCDSFNNLNRTLDRQSFREMEMRVLFQMSAVDSSNLIDLPAASKLGPNRAYCYVEETESLEKFRPYALPSEKFLATVRERLQQRHVE